MRRAIAAFLPVLMIATVILCGMTTCSEMTGESHACCHHRSGTPSAPNTATHQCVHTLFERGKIAGVVQVAAPVTTWAAPDTQTILYTAPVTERLADSSDLFLRIRVLLV